jgi:[acyl-carrier-protein] S-malonyltransferase
MIDWNRTAFVFPGQGSQTIGMMKDLAESYPVAQQTFSKADSILGFGLTELCFNGPEEVLNDTINTQPALYTAGIAMLRVLQTVIPQAKAGAMAGHSLGEFTALAAANAISFADGLRLVRERGRLMKEAGIRSPGAMAAVLGLDAARIREICAEASQKTNGVLILANDNCPGQSVISGDEATLEIGSKLLSEAGAKRVLKLAVSIAAHSPLMQSAADDFRSTLANTAFLVCSMPVYGNVQAAPLGDANDIREELDLQLTHSVRWTESVQSMIASGITTFVECGPKDVLTGLLKRIDRSAVGYALNSVDGLQKMISETVA